jgi:hypothetical protein
MSKAKKNWFPCCLATLVGGAHTVHVVRHRVVWDRHGREGESRTARSVRQDNGLGATEDNLWALNLPGHSPTEREDGRLAGLGPCTGVLPLELRPGWSTQEVGQ